MDLLSRFSRYFLTVARTGNLRKASEILCVSTPAIHRQIQLGEQHYGVLLFDRLSSGMRLTTAGELLYTTLQKWEKESLITQEYFDEFRGMKRGHVVIGIIKALSSGLVIDTIQEITKTYPWITFDVQIYDSHIVGEKTAKADLDMGILIDPLESLGLEVTAFTQMPVGFVTHPENPLSTLESISIGQALEYRNIIPASPLIVHDRVMQLYRRHHFKPEVSVQCNDTQMIKSMVKAKYGLSILSKIDVLNELKDGSLCFIPLKDRTIRPLTIGLCVAAKMQLSQAAQLVLKILGEHIENLK
ncbi:LysR family transcriptional regulator [Pectobacterium cacticida]|uniref:LysR family transcriptional regulator n=1 Tax=Pectobacterium cacticida TaxID=69221 RepID=UPI0039889722